MLYDRWRQIAGEHRAEIALWDFASGRAWTFAAIAAEIEGDGAPFSDPARSCESIGSGRKPVLQFPQGADVRFILAVLRAWRENQIVCPLELGQSPPVGGTGVPASRLVSRLAPPIVHLKTTSSTTGAARIVAFTAGQLAADAENVVTTMGLRRDWPNLGVISMAHSYGFSNLVTLLLLHGIPLILAPAPLPETVRQAARLAENITLPAVPAMWRAWLDAGAIPSNVKLAISAGAPLPLALEREIFEKHGLKIHNFYGASECGGIAYDAGETPRTDGACVGSPMKNVSLSVASDGCMEVRSGAVAEGYLQDKRREMANSELQSPKSKVQTLGNGCFHTSDLAEISGKSVFLRGRAGDQINVAGRKVSPETIERALLKHPQVRECLVFGVPSRDAERTEEIVAVVVSREREEMLRQFVLETLPAWQSPRHWWFVEALQTNPRGKVSRAEWRTGFLAAS